MIRYNLFKVNFFHEGVGISFSIKSEIFGNALAPKRKNNMGIG